MKTLAIVGGGFCGVATAVGVLRQAAGHINIILIDRAPTASGGVAYGLARPEHFLNVPAGNMSAIYDDPDAFLRYCGKRFPGTVSHSFVPRYLYGEYLQALLNDTSAEWTGTARCLFGEVQSIQRDASGVQLFLDDGVVLRADHVVIASGNLSAHHVPGITQVGNPPGYWPEPWCVDFPSIGASAPVLLIGSGLTAIDMLASLMVGGHQGPVYMLSRRGLLPNPHRPQRPGSGLETLLAEQLLKGPASATSYLGAVRRSVASHREAGVDWRDVIASLRQATPALWERLPGHERGRFLRHLQPFWDVHRHRISPDSFQLLTGALAGRQVQRMAGRLVEIRQFGEGLSVDIRPRGSEDLVELRVQHIIRCTGTDFKMSCNSDPLFTQLLAEGFLQLDSHGLGINVTPELAVIDAKGSPLDWLSYVGPLLKAKFWEATAVPELRQHCHFLARRLTVSLW